MRTVVPLLALLLLAGAARADTTVVRIDEQQFHADAGKITFTEVPLGTRNPTYPPARYHGGRDSPTVTFSGFFKGRRIASPADCPTGAAPTGCLSGTVAAPLALDRDSPPAFTGHDQMNGRTIAVLVGTPKFNGPIAILFDKDVAAVGLIGGYFDAIGGTAITIYDRAGQKLGEISNQHLGFESLGLATPDLVPRIAGLEFHLVGGEPQGFGVHDIRFGAPAQVDLPGPKPSPKARAPILP